MKGRAGCCTIGAVPTLAIGCIFGEGGNGVDGGNQERRHSAANRSLQNIQNFQRWEGALDAPFLWD